MCDDDPYNLQQFILAQRENYPIVLGAYGTEGSHLVGCGMSSLKLLGSGIGKGGAQVL